MSFSSPSHSSSSQPSAADPSPSSSFFAAFLGDRGSLDGVATPSYPMSSSGAPPATTAMTGHRPQPPYPTYHPFMQPQPFPPPYPFGPPAFLPPPRFQTHHSYSPPFPSSQQTPQGPPSNDLKSIEQHILRLLGKEPSTDATTDTSEEIPKESNSNHSTIQTPQPPSNQLLLATDHDQDVQLPTAPPTATFPGHAHHANGKRWVAKQNNSSNNPLASSPSDTSSSSAQPQSQPPPSQPSSSETYHNATRNYTRPLPHYASQLTKDKVDRITKDMLTTYQALRPAQVEVDKKLSLLPRLQHIVTRALSDYNAQLHLFGSSANDMCLRHGDLDLCLTVDQTLGSREQIVELLAEILQRNGMKNVVSLSRARVPIVKFVDPKSRLSCDICVNNLLALYNTRLIAAYAEIDPRLRTMCYIIKHWAKKRQLNEPYRGTPSSYAWVLLVIHFLQQRDPPVLPCLQAMGRKRQRRQQPLLVATATAGGSVAPANAKQQPQSATSSPPVGEEGGESGVAEEELVEGFDCYYYKATDKLRDFGKRNEESLGSLLAAFFCFYAHEFEYRHKVVSVRTGGCLTKEEKDWERIPTDIRENHWFSIEDPFELTHDLGRVVDRENLKAIRFELRKAFQQLCRTGNLRALFVQYKG
ncbi:RNA uridylyltransferase [Balamuthia mandrillaris]